MAQWISIYLKSSGRHITHKFKPSPFGAENTIFKQRWLSRISFSAPMKLSSTSSEKSNQKLYITIPHGQLHTISTNWILAHGQRTRTFQNHSSTKILQTQTSTSTSQLTTLKQWKLLKKPLVKNTNTSTNFEKYGQVL